MIIERLGIAVFLCTVSVFCVFARARHVAILFLSISFQTNLMAVGYFMAIELGQMRVAALLQMLSMCNLGFVALVWIAFLGGQEAGWAEWAFNVVIHYQTFVMVWASSQTHKLRWPSPVWLVWYPLAYLTARPWIDAWIGWPMYPFVDGNLLFIVGAAVAWCSVCLTYLRPSRRIDSKDQKSR